MTAFRQRAPRVSSCAQLQGPLVNASSRQRAGACIAGALAPSPVLAPAALAELALLAALAWGGAAAPTWRGTLTALAAVLALALSLHLLLGFHPAVLFHDVRLTPDAAPFALALGFDKAAAGLLLLAAFSVRVASWRQFASQLPAIVAAALATSVVATAPCGLNPATHGQGQLASRRQLRPACFAS